MDGTLPADTDIEVVDLTIRDVDKALAFYRDLLGLRRMRQDGSVTRLGVDRRAFLRLHETPDAPARPSRAAGLFHVAYLLPDRAHLGRFIRRLIEAQHPVEGASDHLVSEAIYLRDPEGNGVEVYADRPRDAWGRDANGIAMATRPLGVQSLIEAAGTSRYERAPTGTKVGHIHLQVHDVAGAEAFYRDAIGLDLTARYGADASFLSAGGYHHHVAVNAWGTRGGPPSRPGDLGLRDYTLRVPTPDALEALGKRLQQVRTPHERDRDGLTASDPSGNRVRIVA